MSEVETVRLAVCEHFYFDATRPESFDWSVCLNQRERDIAEVLAAEIVMRRGMRFEEFGEDGDPLLPGLQEALRLLSKRLIWKVTRVEVAAAGTSVMKEDSSHEDNLSDRRSGVGDLPLPDVRPNPLRHDGSRSQVRVARPVGARKRSQGHGPRFVGGSLDMEHNGS